MLKYQHKILFVDDEPENLKLIERAFRNIHTVFIAESPEEAFHLLDSNEISLIMSDQRMPDMSGLELLTQVSNRSPNTIRFLLTGLVDSDDIHSALNNDLIYGYVIKPFKVADLKTSIMRALQFYELRQENQRLRQDWQQTMRESTTLLGAGSALTSGADANTVLERIVNVVCSDFGYQSCAIELIDKNSWELFIRACAGFPEASRDKRLPIEGEGVVSYVARTGKLTCLPDVSRDERYVADNPSTRSQLAIPLRIGEEIIGVLNIESTKLDAFTDRDVLILSSFADKASAIVQQAHLFDQVARGKAEWESTFDAIADAIFIFDRKRRLRRVNIAGAKLLNRTYDQLLGETCCALFRDEERTGCLTRRLFAEGERIVECLRMGDNEIITTVDPIRGEKKQLLGCVLTMRAQH